MEFKFTQHKGVDVYLVKMAEEDFEALEDNQVLVQVLQMHKIVLKNRHFRLMPSRSPNRARCPDIASIWHVEHMFRDVLTSFPHSCL